MYLQELIGKAIGEQVVGNALTGRPWGSAL